MFKPGDLVQPRMGGPKLKVVEVKDEQIVAVQASNESGEKYTLKVADVTRYSEEGDFGVC
ncbi:MULTISPECIES: hypothetical protein [Citrobacter]|uniref:Uncharacterized protein n=1 Tax=Citrobacter youngae TaxID=133448 RepID=A0A9Q7ZMS3_9ENTR|nr:MULTISPECIES: hypothetical protein [Citrobacter]TKU09995.1 hypothetical protein FDW86_08510 [Citrobacter sp. wls828]AYL62632.1 hypothetical protein CUC49_13770 [Citrobacter pasteurii]EIS7449195.1 hypothetical protein [Citrobacter youngae]MBA8104887.1 hypothetical protein [Citrobacter sp. RHBSTW-00029]MBJ8739401.1 hypothetical protein [Citrobacter sp. FDAARGOS_156]